MTRVLRLIYRDILSLTRLPPAVKIIGSILGIALLVGGWYFQEWLTAPGHFNRMARNPSRLEMAAVIFGILFLCYLSLVIDRVRRSP